MQDTAERSDVDRLFDDVVPSRPRKPRDPRQWDLVQAYRELLVPEHRSSGQVALWDCGRPVFRPGWETRHRALTLGELKGALFHGEKLDVRGVERVAYVAIDVDAHAAADGAQAPRSTVVALDAMLRGRGRGQAKAAARRRAVHAAAWPAVREILDRVPGSFAERTKRGFRAYLALGRAAPVAEARAIGLGMIAGVEAPAGVGLEVFPKIAGDGLGSMCSLPLTGRGRLLRADGKLQHRTRVEDLEILLQRVLDARGGDVHVAPAEAPIVANVAAGVDSRSGQPAGEGPMAKAWGADFAEKMRRIWFDGIDDDESFEAVRAIAFQEMAQAVPPSVTDAAVARWAEMPEHRATHTATASGRRGLLRTLRACRRHYARGVASGRLEPGRMRAPALRARIYELASSPDVELREAA